MLFETGTYFYIIQIFVRFQGCAMGEAVNRRFVAVTVRLQAWFFTCGILA